MIFIQLAAGLICTGTIIYVATLVAYRFTAIGRIADMYIDTLPGCKNNVHPG